MEASEKVAWLIFVTGLLGLIPVTVLLWDSAPRGVVLGFVGYMSVLVVLEALVPAILAGKAFRLDLREMWVSHCG